MPRLRRRRLILAVLDDGGPDAQRWAGPVCRGPVDTCGAGDQFAASATAALLAGADADAAVRSAVMEAAAYVTAGAAATASVRVPARPDLESALPEEGAALRVGGSWSPDVS